ncbi:MAG: class I SAM-dependent methyltransferase [Pirellulaceae bacterium]
MLIDVPLTPTQEAWPRRAAEFVAAGRARFRRIDCFEFVQCDYELAWRALASLPRGRFCEWGSGWGIVTGLAEMLGFHARGIEIDERLAAASRELLAEFQLSCPIECGDYCEVPSPADVYFVYCWPGRILLTEEHFEKTAPPGARLVIAYGQSDLRCKMVATT